MKTEAPTLASAGMSTTANEKEPSLAQVQVPIERKTALFSARRTVGFRLPPAAIEYLRLSSSFFAVLGGTLLASHTDISGFGFIFLAMSSSQMLVSSCFAKDLNMILYSGSVFFFVDSFGIYRWLLT